MLQGLGFEVQRPNHGSVRPQILLFIVNVGPGRVVTFDGLQINSFSSPTSDRRRKRRRRRRQGLGVRCLPIRAPPHHPHRRGPSIQVHNTRRDQVDRGLRPQPPILQYFLDGERIRATLPFS